MCKNVKCNINKVWNQDTACKQMQWLSKWISTEYESVHSSVLWYFHVTESFLFLYWSCQDIQTWAEFDSRVVLMFKSTVICSVCLKYSCNTGVLFLISSKMDRDVSKYTRSCNGVVITPAAVHQKLISAHLACSTLPKPALAVSWN